MDRPGFDREKLHRELARLNWVEPGSPGPEARRYTAFYGLDKLIAIPTISYHIGYFEAGFEYITTQLFLQENAHGTVVLCHGYYDHAGIYGKVIRALLEDRFNVVVYDLPGHGLSTGSEVAIHSFDEYQIILDECLCFMEGNLPKPWFAVGQSTGGAILMHHALHRQDRSPFEKQVLFAPLVRPVHWGKSQFMYHLISPFRAYVKRDFVDNTHDREFLFFLKNHDVLQSKKLSSRWVGSLKKWIKWFEENSTTSSLPTLVIQGQQDQTVDWQHNIPEIQDRFPGLDVFYVADGMHQLVNESEEIRSAIFRQMLDFLRKDT